MIGLNTCVLLHLWLDDDPAQSRQALRSSLQAAQGQAALTDRLTTQGTGLDVSTRTTEAVSGRPIRLLEDASLLVIATLSMARDGAAEHVLRYRSWMWGSILRENSNLQLIFFWYEINIK